MKNWRSYLIFVGLLLIIFLFPYSVLKKESLLENGEVVLLKLAPVDPRSLMQGDYMTLNYDIPETLRNNIQKAIKGKLVFTKDKNQVAQLIRIHDEKIPLAESESLLFFRAAHRWQINLGASSFFFQEGKAKQFAGAEYGELRVEKNGKPLLVGLRDKDYKLLGLSSGLSE